MSSAEPANVEQPRHPLPQLTSSERTRFKRDLIIALKDPVIGVAPVAADLRAKLDEVLAECESRDQLAQTINRRGTVGL